ncbi:MAG: DUF169 domain-containing protein [Desulfuromonadaceae bacterium]|nr:DUF169 domain-containing protein [Desulfuromonadaceae bacterium]
MAPTETALERLRNALRLTTPIIALYDAEPDESFEPRVEAKGGACCFAYYQRWLKGETLVVRRGEGEDFRTPRHGCPGLQSHFGFTRKYPPWMANFLTDGKNGAPLGEGLKASPTLAQEYLDRIVYPEPSTDTVLMGPLRLDHWQDIRTITFFSDPDRLSALMTLAAFRTSDPEAIQAPFSSGCGLLWEAFGHHTRDRAVIGCTDIAMRRYIPRDLLCLTVTPARFEKMVDFPDDAFLMRSWWKELLDAREREYSVAEKK